MKKKIMYLMLCLVGLGQTRAADVLMVENVVLPQGSEKELTVGCQFENSYKAYQLDIQLPEGLALTLDEKGKPVCEKGFTDTDHSISCSVMGTGLYRFVCTSMNNELLPQSGALLKVHVVATAGNVGDVLGGKVTATEFTSVDYDVVNLADVAFTVTIAETPDTHTVLDENATSAPATSDGVVDVRMKRTLRGGVWNTLVIPFDMTAEQVKTAFGDEAKVATFEGAETETDAEENVVGISVNFANATSIAANVPCLVWTANDLTEWTVDGVTIAPVEEPSVDKDELRLGSGTKKDPYRYLYNSFVGTYVAGTQMGENTLFLNGNKFYYTDGTTTIKAFRAYFDLYDVLSDVENAGGAVKLNVSMDGTETAIESIQTGTQDAIGNETVYDLSGRRLPQTGTLKKGVYIVNGKKILK